MEDELATLDAAELDRESKAADGLQRYTVRPGDVITLVLTGFDDNPFSTQEIRVRAHDDGTIALPIVGTVHVAGSSLQKVEQQLLEAYSTLYVDRISVLAEPAKEDDARRRQEVYVYGLVSAPGPVLVPSNGGLSIVRAIASAGGFRDFLEPPEATLWRRLPNGQQVRVKVELAAVLAGQAPDIQMWPGDVLQIPHTAETRLAEWAAYNLRLGPFGTGLKYDPLAQYNANRALDGHATQNAIRQGLAIPSVVVPSATEGQ